jgi:ligand-binding sensor domain-containing protein
MIKNVVIDGNGNKWICAIYGLFKFDGTNWISYFTNNSGLPDNTVNSIAIDGNGDKWIGTNNGLAKFDGSNWTVYNTLNSGLPNNIVNSITIDGNGDKWICTNAGLAKFNGMNWISTFNGLPNNAPINSLTIDGFGNKWISTELGLAKFNGTICTFYNILNSVIPSNSVYSTIIDTAGIMWICTNGGLAKLNGSQWTIYKKDISGISNSNIRSITKDAIGNLWIATNNNGLIKFRENIMPAINTSNSSLSGNSIKSIAFDNNGDKWIGLANGGGLTKYDGTNWNTYNTNNSGLPDNNVNSIAIDGNGDKWIGTNNGLAIFNGTNWNVYNTTNSGLPNNNITCLSIDGSGNKWIGTSSGLAKFDGNLWMIYNTSLGFPSNSITSLSIDMAGNIWVGTNGGGLIKFTGSFWTVYNSSNSGLINGNITCITIDGSGNKWIGIYGIGIFKFNGINFIHYNNLNSGLPSNNVNTIEIDGSGNKWIGTNNKGLTKFDDTTWTTYNLSNSGLPNNNVQTIKIENNDRKRIGTYSGGLAAFNTITSLPDPAGIISGLTTVCQGQNSVTYSIPNINNATLYIWSIPTGATGNSTTNTITVNYSSSAISGNISVKGHNNCGDGASSILAITINPLPVDAGVISGITSVCQGQNSIIYTVPTIINAISYIWTLPAGATGSSSTNSIIVNYGASAVSGNISVYGVNSCGIGSSSDLAITVSSVPPNAAGTITGTTSVCRGQTDVIYNVSAIANATSYVWSLPTGATGSSSTNTISVNFGTTAVSGNITVKGSNACSDGISSSKSITVNTLPTNAGIISGATTVCKGQNNKIYSIVAIPNATSYSWTLPSGASGNSITNTISVNFSNSAISGNITVKGSNSCGENNPSSLSITVKAIPDMASGITGEDSVNQGQGNIAYTVPLIANASTYSWTLPANVSGNSSNNFINLNFSDSSLSGNLTLKGQNECGIGEPTSIYIKVFKQLNINLFLEGIYQPLTLMMAKVQDENGDHFPGNISDTLNVSLHSNASPYQLLHLFANINLLQNGWCSLRIPSEINQAYYMAIRHRNHIETWSSFPVSFANNTVTYDFTNSIDKAYGDNQKQVSPGKFALMVGDSNQDGVVDLSDLVIMDSDLTNGTVAYIVYDLNGDGVVDLSDLVMIDENLTNGVVVMTP